MDKLGLVRKSRAVELLGTKCWDSPQSCRPWTWDSEVQCSHLKFQFCHGKLYFWTHKLINLELLLLNKIVRAWRELWDLQWSRRKGLAQAWVMEPKWTNNNSAIVNTVMSLSFGEAPVISWDYFLTSNKPKVPYLWTVSHKRMYKLNKMLYAVLNVSAETRCWRVGMSWDKDCKWMMSSFQFGAEI